MEDELLYSLNTGYNWTSSSSLGPHYGHVTSTNPDYDRQRQMNLTTSLLLHVRGKVTVAHEELLKKQQKQLIEEEESLLKKRIIELNECSQETFSSSMVEMLSKLLLENTHSQSSSPEWQPFSLIPDDFHLGTAFDADLVVAANKISSFADRYIIEKKRRAVIELEAAFAEMIEEVETRGKELWRMETDAAQRAIVDEAVLLNSDKRDPETLELRQLLAEESMLEACVREQHHTAALIAINELHQHLQAEGNQSFEQLREVCTTLESRSISNWREVGALLMNQHNNDESLMAPTSSSPKQHTPRRTAKSPLIASITEAESSRESPPLWRMAKKQSKDSLDNIAANTLEIKRIFKELVATEIQQTIAEFERRLTN